MVKDHGFSLTEIDNMIPFERDVYIAYIEDYIKKQEEEMKNNDHGTF